MSDPGGERSVELMEHEVEDLIQIHHERIKFHRERIEELRDKLIAARARFHE